MVDELSIARRPPLPWTAAGALSRPTFRTPKAPRPARQQARRSAPPEVGVRGQDAATAVPSISRSASAIRSARRSVRRRIPAAPLRWEVRRPGHSWPSTARCQRHAPRWGESIHRIRAPDTVQPHQGICAVRNYLKYMARMDPPYPVHVQRRHVRNRLGHLIQKIFRCCRGRFRRSGVKSADQTHEPPRNRGVGPSPWGKKYLDPLSTPSISRAYEQRPGLSSNET